MTDEQIGQWVLDGATTNMIALMLDECFNTIDRRFGKLIAKKRAERKMRLAQAQTRLATEGDRTMLIWLGKNELGQSDQPPDDADAQPELEPKVG